MHAQHQGERREPGEEEEEEEEEEKEDVFKADTVNEEGDIWTCRQ